MNTTNNTRGFNSNFGAIMAAVGSAVGLGNIWRFPYAAGENGGGAFVLVYILFVFSIGVVVLLSEMIIGRRSQANAVGAFSALRPKRRGWRAVGALGVLSAVMIYAFYSVISGWTLNYVVFSATGKMSGKSPDEITALFDAFKSDSVLPLVYQFIFMAITAMVVLGGVKKGIEKTSKILMPVLFLLVVALAVRSVTLPGADKGIEFLFKPDFSKLGISGLLDALGQALFSLSIGMGAMITYGSYIRKQDSLFKTGMSVVISDTVIAVLSGVAVFPAVFAFGMEPAGGPGLVFDVLPNVFNSMPMGNVFSILFFILLAIAALTSMISLLEDVVAWAVEERHWKRTTATVCISFFIFLIGIACSLSFGLMKDVTIAGLTIFDFLDRLTANYFLPIGALATVVFLGWFCKRSDVYDESSNGGSLKVTFFRIFYFILKYIAPIALLIIILTSIIPK